MNKHEWRRWLVVGVAVAGLWSAASAWALSPVTMKVDAVKPLREEGKPRYENAKALELTLANITSKPQENLVLKYSIVTEHVATKEWMLAKQGELKLETFKPMERRVVYSEPVVLQSSIVKIRPTTRTGRQWGDQKQSQPEFKYRGYAVQLMSGDQVLVEMYEPKELKTKLNNLTNLEALDEIEKKKPGKK